MTDWLAGNRERRIALGVAIAALALIAAALISPGLFRTAPDTPDTPAAAPGKAARVADAANAPRLQPDFHIPSPERAAAPQPAPQAPAPQTPAPPAAQRDAVRAATEPGAASHPLPPAPKAAARPAPRRKDAPAKASHAQTSHAKSARTHASAPASRRTAHGDRWFVQVGAFSHRKRARAMLRRIRAKGFDGRIAPKAGGLHAVQAGPRGSRAAAETLAHSLELKAGLKGFLVHDKRR